MRLLDYYKTLTADEKADFARRVGTSTAYLSQLAHGHRSPGWVMALAIIKESGGKVSSEPGGFA